VFLSDSNEQIGPEPRGMFTRVKLVEPSGMIARAQFRSLVERNGKFYRDPIMLGSLDTLDRGSVRICPSCDGRKAELKPRRGSATCELDRVDFISLHSTVATV